MAKKPTADEIRKQKDARAKKVLLVLLPVLIAMVAWQGPKVLKQVRGEDTSSSPAAETATASGETATTPPAAAGAPTDPASTGSTDTTTGETGAAAPAADPGAVVVSDTQTLSDTDLPPPVDEGELIAFSRFDARDPFQQIVQGDAESGDITETNPDVSGGPAPTTPAPSTGGGTPTPSVQPGTSPTAPTTPTTPGVATGQAKISVNGQVQTLSVGDKFPQTDPAFELLAVSAGQVTIGLANGTFSSGVQTITLNLGEPVTLISQPDGARFTLKLVSVG
jgi:hypothetical protein